MTSCYLPVARPQQLLRASAQVTPPFREIVCLSAAELRTVYESEITDLEPFRVHRFRAATNTPCRLWRPLMTWLDKAARGRRRITALG
jgi:hypothetical protein